MSNRRALATLHALREHQEYIKTLWESIYILHNVVIQAPSKALVDVTRVSRLNADLERGLPQLLQRIGKINEELSIWVSFAAEQADESVIHKEA